MRFFSSSAFARAPKLKRAASCSAADAILNPLACHPAALRTAGNLYLPFGGRGGLFGSFGFIRRFGLCLILGLWHRAQSFNAAAHFLDGGLRTFRSVMNFEGGPDLDFSLAEQPHARMGAIDDPRGNQCSERYRLCWIELFRIEGRLDPAQIDFIVLNRIRLVEAPLWQPPVDRHLAALEPRLGAARPRRLAFAAAARRLAEP